MGLRVKLRKTFGSSSKKSNSTSSASNTNTSIGPSIYPDEQHYTDRTDIEYYKPNEIPKSKYRGKVDPAHNASLVAFSFSDAFAATTRRASLALSGTFSPGGTKSQSRAPSRVPSRRPSVADVVPGSHLRTEERAGSGSGSDASRERSEDSNTSNDSAGPGAKSSDTASTSLSGPTSTTGTTAPTTAVALTPLTTLTSPSNPKLAAAQDDGAVNITSCDLSKQITAHDTPFTAEELEMAMTRATLRDRDGLVHEVHVS